MCAIMVALVRIGAVAVGEDGYFVDAKDGQGAGDVAGEGGSLVVGLRTGVVSCVQFRLRGEVLRDYATRQRDAHRPVSTFRGMKDSCWLGGVDLCDCGRGGCAIGSGRDEFGIGLALALLLCRLA